MRSPAKDLRVGIVGSRRFDTPTRVKDYVRRLAEQDKDWDRIEIVSGGAPGPDSFAVTAANALGLDVRVFRAQWDKHGKGAGMLRNTSIVAHVDRVVAFWDGKSKGTLDTMRKAKAAGLPVLVVTEDGTEIVWNE